MIRRIKKRIRPLWADAFDNKGLDGYTALSTPCASQPV